MGGAILGLVDLGSIREEDEQVMGSKPVSSNLTGPLHQFLFSDSRPAWVPALTAFDDEL